VAGGAPIREAVMLVLPSDHVIPDAAAFRAAVLAALPRGRWRATSSPSASCRPA
jgi:mannose-1-phosphate guanylyltransferase